LHFDPSGGSIRGMHDEHADIARPGLGFHEILGVEESSDAVRVLLVDDDEAVRTVLKKGLEIHGFEVRTASHGGEALRGLLTHPVDVVVTDLKMSPMDGLTFLSEALHIWPWLGTVVLSGHVTEETRRKALRLGVGSILSKPVMVDVLSESVREESMAARVRLASRSGAANAFGEHQFSKIWDLSRQAMSADTRQDAIRGLVAAFSDAFKSIASATLTHDAEREMLCVHVSDPVPPAFLDDVRGQIAERGRLLGYKPRSSDQGVDVFGAGLAEDASMPEDYRCVIIPLLGDGDLLGVLTLVVPETRDLGESFMSFLYHATHLLSSAIVALDAIRMQAAHDDLTGFYNRRQLRVELANMWAMSRRYSLTLALLVVDLDYFKNVNDQYGHLIGDQVLRELAALVRYVCRTTDVVGRYGGDELVIVVPDATPESLRILAERLQVAAHEHVFCKGTHDVKCTLSIGGASAGVGPKPKSTDELFERADAALYQAKDGGRDRSVIWEEPSSDSDSGAAAGSPSSEEAPSENSEIRVLVVDDEQHVRDALGLQLGALGYSVATAASGGDALALIADTSTEYQVIMVDLGLGDMSGLELLQTLQEMNSAAARIVITGRATVSNTVECLRAGADDFIQKPITLEDLTLTLPHAVDYHRLRAENRRYQDHLEDLVRQRGTALTEALKRARSSLQFSLNALIKMLDARERITSTHSQRVQHLTIFVAKQMGLPRDEIAMVGQGALLHDVGKIGIPDAILMKPGPLTESEWQTMRTHPGIGYKILKDSPDLQSAALIVMHHHERFDGAGYPQGLSGEQIPLGARIFAVVDAYDAMRSVRPYKAAVSPRDTMREILACRGTHFDPSVVDVFAQIQVEVERRGGWDQEAE
jgi:diguanylate cyclase (GGDEF)-like protein